MIDVSCAVFDVRFGICLWCMLHAHLRAQTSERRAFMCRNKTHVRHGFAIGKPQRSFQPTFQLQYYCSRWFQGTLTIRMRSLGLHQEWREHEHVCVIAQCICRNHTHHMRDVFGVPRALPFRRALRFRIHSPAKSHTIAPSITHEGIVCKHCVPYRVGNLDGFVANYIVRSFLAVCACTR